MGDPLPPLILIFSSPHEEVGVISHLIYTCLCIIPEFKEPEKYHSDIEYISKKYSFPVILSDFVI